MKNLRTIQQDLQISIDYLKKAGCTEISVFGSAASGENDSESDLDIAVRGIEPIHFFEIYGELMMRLSRPVDFADLDMQPIFGRRLSEFGNLKRVA
jgi:predicted nucleotidyltransferase